MVQAGRQGKWGLQGSRPRCLCAGLSAMRPPLWALQARLEVLDAESEGQLGFVLELELANELKQREVAAMLTQVWCAGGGEPCPPCRACHEFGITDIWCPFPLLADPQCCHRLPACTGTFQPLRPPQAAPLPQAAAPRLLVGGRAEPAATAAIPHAVARRLQVVVDPADEAFQKPTKQVGPHYSQQVRSRCACWLNPAGGPWGVCQTGTGAGCQHSMQTPRLSHKPRIWHAS